MKMSLLERLAKGEVLVAWGPLQTLLQQEKGRDLEGHLSQWIVEHPRDFQSVLKAMCEAGSNFAGGGTQGNCRYRLRDFGLENRLYELTLTQIQLAKEVMPESCYLLGQIGLTGRFLEPVGDMTRDELYKAYEEQIIPMLEGGVDVFYLDENDTEQMVVGIKAIRDHCDLPVITLNLFYPTKKGIRTLMGVDVKTATTRLAEASADIVGATCGGISPIGDSLAVVKEMKQACDKPLIIRPDAGLPQVIDDKIVHPVTPEQMAEDAARWIDAGASIVGGCDGTSLKHIKAIAAVAKGEKKY